MKIISNNIRYDANGNVRSLRRLSATGTTIANLSMSYNDNDRGNRLESVAVSTGRLIALTGTNFKIPLG